MRVGKAVALGAIFATALLLVGCGPLNAQALLATLPVTVGTVTFDQSRVIDDSFLSGFVTDDVLAALGKRRADASVVFRYSNSANAQMGAMAVSGISGDVLLQTVAQTLEAPAVVGRGQSTIGDRDVRVLALRDGEVFLAYRRGSVVYWARADSESRAEEFIAAMP